MINWHRLFGLTLADYFTGTAYQVEMEPAPPWLNSLLAGVGKLEVALLRRLPLPIGTSIIAVAQKPPASAPVGPA